MLRFGGKIGNMDRLKLVFGAVLALTEAGLQVSGITNVTLALALWGLAAILLVWGAWHPFKANLLPILSQWRLQWPIQRKKAFQESPALQVEIARVIELKPQRNYTHTDMEMLTKSFLEIHNIFDDKASILLNEIHKYDNELWHQFHLDALIV
jgi:hypothetical protein